VNLRSMMWCAVLLIPGFCAVSQSAVAGDDIPRGRLPKQVVPTAYELELWMDPRQTRFNGTVGINVTVIEPTTRFWLHARDSTLGNVRFTQGDTVFTASATRVQDEAGIVRIDLDRAPIQGAATLTIEFDAPYNLSLEGAYKVTFGDEPYIMTQMEPLGARNAFPCFDEPAFKTPFAIAIIAPRGDNAIANTREIGLEKVKDGWARHVFAKTEPLPTYLIAFAVGPWEIREFDPIPASALRQQPIPLRGIAARGQSKRMSWMLGETAKMVLALEAYFDRAYPYDKLDLLAAPEFGYGAMENAGLITYRDALMFASPEESTMLRRNALSTHVHELGHQWFGNLVTMPWWDDLWLNEAFATWTEGRIVPELYPELRADMDLVEGGIGAMGEDSLASARRIHNPIDDYTDVASAFDGITYQKGGAVLTMFEQWLGPDRYRAALRHHMRRFAFGNATSSDLADSMAAQSDQGAQLRSAFASFIDQPGVPMLDIALDCAGDTPSLAIEQSRYLPIGGTFDAKQSWQIPFCARIGSRNGSERFCTLLTEASSTVELPEQSCKGFVHPNADGAGYYRFRLDASAQKKLAKAFGDLNDAEQLSFVDSVNAALGDGALRSDRFIKDAPTFAAGKYSSTVLAPVDHLLFLKERVVDARGRDRIDAMLRKHWGNRLQSLGLAHRDGDSDDTRILRAWLIGSLLSNGRPEWLVDAMAAEGRKVLGDDKTPFNAKAVGADFLRPALYAVVLADGLPAIRRVRARLDNVEDTIHRGALIGALTAAESPAQFEAVLGLSLDPTFKATELVRLLYGLTSKPQNHPALWAFVKKNDAVLLDRLPAVFKGKISGFGSSLHCTNAGADEVQAFYADRVKDLEGGPRTLAQSVESIRLCAARARKWSETL